MQGRIRCCVPFCRRTTRDRGEFSEWVCGTHWSLVDRRLRQLRTRYRRRWRLRKPEKWFKLDCTMWERMKRQAIERAMGV